MGSAAPSLPMVDRSIVLRGSVLSPQDQDTLCLPFSAKEISDVGMDSCKAPGLDGYNVYFFKQAWGGP